MELKKSYKGFVIWFIGFVLISFSMAFLPISDSELLSRIVFNVVSLSLVVLSYIIYKTEYIYWYNGTSYEEAVKAGTERRKAFGRKHFNRFKTFAIVFFIYSVLAQSLNVSFWIDLLLFGVGIVATAISTIKFKL